MSNNRFDEMVHEAVSEVEPSGPRQKRAPKTPQAKSDKIVSFDMPSQAKKERAKRKSSRDPNSSEEKDVVSELARGLTRPLVTKTVRFRPELAEALNRIVLQNKLLGKKPDTIQELVNEAVESWVSAYQPTR